MAIQLYNPFESLHFNPEECFLTGKKISSTEEQVSVFPEWLINRYSLKDKTFTMLEQNIVSVLSFKEYRLMSHTGKTETCSSVELIFLPVRKHSSGLKCKFSKGL